MSVNDSPPERYLPIPGSTSLCYGFVNDEAAIAINRSAGEIRLQVGDKDWGAIHISGRRAETIYKLGYSYIEQFVQDIATNYTRIYQGRKGRIELWMAEASGKLSPKRNRTNRLLILQENKVDSVWTVITAYEIRLDKRLKGKLLWQRSEPATGGP